MRVIVLNVLIQFCSISPMGLQFLSSASTIHHRPLVLALTSEMADEEEHGSQKNKLGDLQNPAVLACEGLSEVFSPSFQLYAFVHSLSFFLGFLVIVNRENIPKSLRKLDKCS